MTALDWPLGVIVTRDFHREFEVFKYHNLMCMCISDRKNKYFPLKFTVISKRPFTCHRMNHQIWNFIFLWKSIWMWRITRSVINRGWRGDHPRRWHFALNLRWHINSYDFYCFMFCHTLILQSTIINVKNMKIFSDDITNYIYF